MKCQSLWKLARQVADNQSPFNCLSPEAQRHLYKALVLAGSSSIEGPEQEEQIRSVSLCMYYGLNTYHTGTKCIQLLKVRSLVFFYDYYQFHRHRCNIVKILFDVQKLTEKVQKKRRPIRVIYCLHS